MSSTPRDINQTFTAPAAQLSLPVIIAIPVIVAAVLVVVTHLVLRRIHSAFRDAGDGHKDAGDSSSGSGAHKDSSTFLTQHPATTATIAGNQFTFTNNGAGTNNTTVRIENGAFLIDFNDEFASVQCNALFNMEVTILSKDNPSTVVAMGYGRFPYPDFRLPGWHQGSVAYHTNERKFADRGGFVGHAFPLVTDPNVTIPKNMANTYTFTLNQRTNEVYITQGEGMFRFDRVLANNTEFRPNEHPYYPIIGANGRCTVRVRVIQRPDAEIVDTANRAYRAEGMNVQLSPVPSPMTTHSHTFAQQH
ncbi:hypothetical protein H9P43_001641 [Blastocladiella emersonii ATCC 22665]|nr:hypothetical protein H9P43_001641 [Blastocladiella emersonii ATCC 22665]